MSEQQSETAITVSGYGRKLCVLSEYVMRQAVCGYSAYGQRVLDAATRAATAVQLVAQRANDKYWCDEALMSGLTNTLRGQVADAFTLAEKRSLSHVRKPVKRLCAFSTAWKNKLSR